MHEVMKLNIKGIKCDRCDYADMEVEAQRYGYWVNKPCPECQANLLTEEDYAAVCKMQETARKVNIWFNRLPKFIQHLLLRKDGKATRQPMHMNGSGQVNIDFSEAYDSDQ